MHVTMGLVLALVFQLAHVVEHTEFEAVGVMESKQLENEWAIHQVKTTANFAPKDKIISWFVGGLNYQVEHHLFPRVSHIHYPAIRTIVRDTCVRHNLPYNEYSTMTAAVASHFRMMKHLGKKPDTVSTQLELAKAS
jgi:linoleoyl-CoA desaturase